MDDLLQNFLKETDSVKVMDFAVSLSCRDHADDVPVLIEALKDKEEIRRLGAVYALSSLRQEPRAVTPLMNVLLDRAEVVRVRSQAAEGLGCLQHQKAIKTLIICSHDPSPDLRFWWVFALGQITAFKRKKLTRAGIRALEVRALDCGWPEESGLWPIRFEALAMLDRKCPEYSRIYREELARVLADPIANAELWPWASTYATAEEMDGSIEKIAAAGLDPVTLGQLRVL
jgi:HEAT repeat protein